MTPHLDRKPGMFRTGRGACLYVLTLMVGSWAFVLAIGWLICKALA